MQFFIRRTILSGAPIITSIIILVAVVGSSPLWMSSFFMTAYDASGAVLNRMGHDTSLDVQTYNLGAVRTSDPVLQDEARAEFLKDPRLQPAKPIQRTGGVQSTDKVQRTQSAADLMRLSPGVEMLPIEMLRIDDAELPLQTQ